MSAFTTEDADAIRDALSAGPPSKRATRWLHLSNDQLERLWLSVGRDVDLAVDALRMRPSPSWLMGVLHPARTSKP